MVPSVSLKHFFNLSLVFFYFMDKVFLLADEELIIRNGGEMPEVTFHSSLFYLTKDLEGPQITLDSQDLLRLKKAVIQGYRKIILRDLEPANRDQGFYRGLERCRINWLRLERFCAYEELNLDGFRLEIITALKNFLAREVSETQKGLRSSSINCSVAKLASLSDRLGLDPAELPDGWQHICLEI